jgi:hypothetical protein
MKKADLVSWREVLRFVEGVFVFAHVSKVKKSSLYNVLSPQKKAVWCLLRPSYNVPDVCCLCFFFDNKLTADIMCCVLSGVFYNNEKLVTRCVNRYYTICVPVQFVSLAHDSCCVFWHKVS